MAPSRTPFFELSLGLVLVLFAAGAAGAGETHYQHFAVGERAAGMAGAFTALADEATGAYYNPAGIVDATKDKRLAVGVTASAYQLAFARFESRLSLGDKSQDLSISDFSSFASGFGYVHALGAERRHALAFTLVVPDNESLSSVTSLQGATVPPSSRLSGIGITDGRYSATARSLDQTIWFGLSYAARLHERVSLGASFLYSLRRQNIVSSYAAEGQATQGNFALTETQRYESIHGAVAGELGVKVRATEHLRFGLSLRSPTLRAHQGGSAFVARFEGDPTVASGADLEIRAPEPLRLSFGAAWEVPGRYTLAFDLRWFGSVSPYSALTYRAPSGTIGTSAPVARDDVVNFALGGEWRLGQSFALRGGFYTDFTARPAQPLVIDGTDRVNLYGFALGFAWLTKETTLSLAINYAFGFGDVASVRNRYADNEEVFAGSAFRQFLTIVIGGSYGL